MVTLAVAAGVHRGPIVIEEATLLSTVLGAAVGALASYLGFRSNGKKDDEE